jgi:hypothetical protein
MEKPAIELNKEISEKETNCVVGFWCKKYTLIYCKSQQSFPHIVLPFFVSPALTSVADPEDFSPCQLQCSRCPRFFLPAA